MKRTSLNKSWKFHLGDLGSAFETTYDTSSWEEVSLPHDWSVAYPKDRAYSSGTGYVIGGIGWYKKTFTLTEADSHMEHFLQFDGVYKNSQVWINGYYLGKRPYGYISFSYKVTDYLYYDGRENVISVKVSHEDIADSRWFTGSGIYRKVELVSYDIAYPQENGIFFYADKVTSEKADFVVEVQVTTPAEALDGTLYALLHAPDGTLSAKAEVACHLHHGAYSVLYLHGEVESPSLWSPGSPSLYDLSVQIKTADGLESIIYSGKVGIRDIRFDPDEGFFLNGVHTLLKGICVHHDGGALGAAVTKNVWRRRLEKLKKMGANAIRMSHNPHMPELYDLCDEMGFMVIDEAFDEWEGFKNKWHQGHNVYPPKHQGYAEDFPQWYATDLTDLVCRDRNHPSIIMWSIGNEIDYPNDPYNHPSFATMTGNNDANKPSAEREYRPGRPNMERLAVLSKELCSLVEICDPTRPVSAAVAFPELSTTLGYIDPMDVVGYNYKEQLYDEHHAKFPDKSFLGSENGHSYAAWKAVLDRPFISGQFLWTGVDFLGECHGWPYHSSSAGLLTTAGFEKARYYERMSWWSEAPVLSLVTARPDEGPAWRRQFHQSWNYIPGEPVEVRAYSNTGLPTLSLNGKPCNVSPVENGENGYYSWIIPFEPGILEAVSEKGTTASLETTGAPAMLCAIDAGSEDVCQVEVTVCDIDGRRVPNDATRIYLSIEGDAEFLGMDNGDVCDITDYREPMRHALDGRLMVYLRKKADSVTINLTAIGLQGTSITL